MNIHPSLAYEPLSAQDAWQSAALKELMGSLQRNSPFYRELFAAHGVRPDQIQSLSDLSSLPFTDKTQMQERNLDFLAVDSSLVREYTATSGTLGSPVTIALTENDLRRLAYNEKQSFLCADGAPANRYQLMLTLDRQFMAGMAYYMGIREMGASMIRTGPGLPAMQWDTILRLQPDSMVAVPSFILKLIEWANQNSIDLQSQPLKKAVCIGESLRGQDFELNALGQKIFGQWPLKLYGTYASTEMQTAFTECGAGRGGHQQPDLIILEVVDEEGKQLGEGEYGEVVVTTLGVEGMPLLRYRTGDICAYYDEPCSCGRLSRRLGPVIGRKQQMIKYRGTTLYPPAIFDMLNGIGFIREYVVEVFTNDLGTDELRLHLHTLLSIDDCEHKLRPLLQAKLRVAPHLHFHSASEMQQMQFPSSGRKQLRFIDTRKN